MIGVASTTGEPGATTVALALACAISRQGKRCLFADLDTKGSALYARFGIEQTIRLNRLASLPAENPVESAVARVTETMDFLPGVNTPYETYGLAQKWGSLLDKIASYSGEVVADLGRLNPIFLPSSEAASYVDILLIVARPDLDYDLQLRHWMDAISHIRKEKPTYLVVVDRERETTPQQFAASVAYPLVAVIPDSPDAKALRKGAIPNDKTYSAKKATFWRAMESLGQRLLAAADAGHGGKVAAVSADEGSAAGGAS